MEEKVLYNVLKVIGSGKEYDAAPDKDYLKALETVGIIKMGWDNTLTDLGRTIFYNLQNKLESW